MRVLVVEDDGALRRSLAAALRSNGMTVHDTPDGAGALRSVRAMPYDLVLLDLGLPDIDGVRLLPQLRAHHAGPVIVLSARRDQSDKVGALDVGADDYLTKPFGLPELLARIRAVARRTGSGGVVETACFRVDLAHQLVTDPAGSVLPLTATEWAVLAALARADGAVVAPEDLLAQVWHETDGEHRNYVRVYVNLLRRKLEADPGVPCCILSQPGRGYRLDVRHAQAQSGPDA